MECEHCNLPFTSKYTLKVHLRTNKACLKKRGLEIDTKFICTACKHICANNTNLSQHLDICKKYICLKVQEEYEMKIKESISIHAKDLEDYKKTQIKHIKEIIDLQHKFKEKNKKILDLEVRLEKFENALLGNLTKNYNTNKTMNESDDYKDLDNIPIPLKEQISSIIIEDIKDDSVNYSMITLNNVSITSRPIDHYVNATQLCQAGGKKFSHWFSLDSTKELINALESDAGIPASQLIDTKKGQSSHFNQGSWIHPDLSISLAQWISPQFSIQVSKWVRTLFNKGLVEIDLNLLREKNDRIKKLENVCLSKQRRVEYPEKNVIYLLTTEDHLKRHTYIIGKAKNLTTRLGTYNKTCDHKVVYYKECKSEDDMDIAETMVLVKLQDYKEQANRDRVILPEDKDVSFFIEVINNCIDFLK